MESSSPSHSTKLVALKSGSSPNCTPGVLKLICEMYSGDGNRLMEMNVILSYRAIRSCMYSILISIFISRHQELKCCNTGLPRAFEYASQECWWFSLSTSIPLSHNKQSSISPCFETSMLQSNIAIDLLAVEENVAKSCDSGLQAYNVTKRPIWKLQFLQFCTSLTYKNQQYITIFGKFGILVGVFPLHAWLLLDPLTC